MKTSPLLASLLLFGLSTAPLAAAPRDGTLVQGSNPDVFLIKDGKRCPICSPKMVAELGLKMQDVIKISDEDLEAIPEGTL